MPRKELALPLATGPPIELHSERYLHDLVGTNGVGCYEVSLSRKHADNALVGNAIKVHETP